MTIKFICSCGKHLRARDEMARRRSICPRCGNPVGIPSLTPLHREAPLGPMTRAEVYKRSIRASTAGPAKTTAVDEGKAAAKDDPLRRMLRDHIEMLMNPSAHQSRSLEKYWYQCLLYPVRVSVLVLGLAGALTVLCGGTFLALPRLMALELSWANFGVLTGLYLLAPFVIIGFACLLLEGALKTVPVGIVEVHWFLRHLGLALHSSLTWLVCFLAGPIFLVGGSVLYWFYCGDPQWIDWIILADLNILGMSYGIFALLAVSESANLFDANPICIADLAHRLGFPGIAVAVLTATVVLLHGLLALAALQQLRDNPGVGWILLFGCWASGMFWVAFLLRLLGVWCRRSMTASSDEPVH